MKRPGETSKARPSSLALNEARVWRALRKPLRWRLFEAVRASGGITAQALAARVGMTPQLTLYHLRLLQSAGLLAHGGGRRARGQGGRFTATRASIEVHASRRDALATRRLLALARAFEQETHAADGPLAPSPRWERLNAGEVRRIESLVGEIERVLASARARREGDASIPAATHVMAFGVRPVSGSGPLATAGWRRGGGR